MHVLFALLGAALAVIGYIFLTRKVLDGTPQNFATYLLWALLDGVVALSSLIKGGNWVLPATYVASCVVVLVAIWRKKTFTWTLTETIASIFVVVSIIVWFFQGPVGAALVGTLGCVVAGIPQLLDLVRDPKDAPVREYIIFTLANGVTIFAGHDWSIPERFYSASCTVLTIGFVLVGLRKFSRQRAIA